VALTTHRYGDREIARAAKALHCPSQAGDVVAKGDPLLVISAMKMEMVVAATVDGQVKDVAVTTGMHVEGEDLLVEIE